MNNTERSAREGKHEKAPQKVLKEKNTAKKRTKDPLRKNSRKKTRKTTTKKSRMNEHPGIAPAEELAQKTPREVTHG